jgi:hypothetical protein
MSLIAQWFSVAIEPKTPGNSFCRALASIPQPPVERGFTSLRSRNDWNDRLDRRSLTVFGSCKVAGFAVIFRSTIESFLSQTDKADFGFSIPMSTVAPIALTILTLAL